MGHVTLFYAIVGVPQSIFSVRIDTNRSLGHLKNTIKTEKPSMIHCDVIDMQLFLTKRDGGHGAWMTEEVVQQGVTETKELHRLNTITARLSSCGLSEQDVQTQSTANSLVHVLVVVSKRCWPPVGCVTVGVTQYMRVNPPRLVAFWNALRATSTKIVANDVIVLPEGTNNFIFSRRTSRVYVRHCYLQLWKACSDTVNRAATTKHNVVVIGNEGIGKTHFGFFVLLCLARRGATVVYEKYRASGRYLFSNDMVIDGLGSDFDDVLEQPNTFYVVNDVKPAQCEAKTILISSPCGSVWYDFYKRDCARFYMPVWTKQEIFNCRELILSGTTEDTVEERYRRWGGNARYVLCTVRLQSSQDFFDMSINDFSLNSLVEASDESGGIENLIFLLLHYRVNDDFSKDGFVFASDHVCEKVYKKLLWQNRGDLMNIFASSRRSSGDHAVLYESLDDA